MITATFSGALSTLTTSGSAMTPNGFKCLLPMARDTASDPFTRAMYTHPPRARMRASSAGSVGLWSTDSAHAPPFFVTSTARESPVLATHT